MITVMVKETNVICGKHSGFDPHKPTNPSVWSHFQPTKYWCLVMPLGISYRYRMLCPLAFGLSTKFSVHTSASTTWQGVLRDKEMKLGEYRRTQVYVSDLFDWEWWRCVVQGYVVQGGFIVVTLTVRVRSSEAALLYWRSDGSSIPANCFVWATLWCWRNTDKKSAWKMQLSWPWEVPYTVEENKPKSFWERGFFLGCWW